MQTRVWLALGWQAMIANPLATGARSGAGWYSTRLRSLMGCSRCLYACIAGWSLATPPLPRAARALAVVSRCYGYAGDAPCLPGRDNGLGRIGDAEWHAYSTVWLAFSGIALAVGLYRHNEWLRRAALAGIGLVAAKVFLSDMAQLEGVLRALSLLGLGVQVGIGYGYRRLRPLQPEQS